MGRRRRCQRIVGRVPLAELTVFVIALLARLGVVLTSGGLSGDFGYDAGVYYSAADALSFGRLPYRDFVLLHPPGIMLALAPFAWLGRVTSDHLGFMVADVAFMVLGAINAVLVVRVGGAIGLPRRSALLGGVFYAVWLGSVGAEFLSRLEPLGNFLVLCGLLAYVKARSSPRRLLPVLAGLGFGAAACVKIWWSVPLVVLFAWHLPRQRRKDLPRVLLGAAAALVAIAGPFFAAAPVQMWHMVVTEQLGRAPANLSPLVRLRALSGASLIVAHAGATAADWLVLVLGCVFLVVLVRAFRTSAGRLFVLLVVAQLIVLLSAPSWFNFYADYVAPAAALCVAAASSAGSAARSRQRDRRFGRALAPLATGVAAAITVGFLVPGNHTITPFPGGRLAEAVESVRCVMADAPIGLIMLDSLSRDFRDGCRDWVDVTGRTYGVDDAFAPDGRHLPRRDNRKWQRAVLGYLRSGQAAIVVRAGGDGLTPATIAALRRGGTFARAEDVIVYRTPDAADARSR
jgi:hypothetical protein